MTIYWEFFYLFFLTNFIVPFSFSICAVFYLNNSIHWHLIVLLVYFALPCQVVHYWCYILHQFTLYYQF